ncbi:hypothetical protein [Paenibacillus sp. MMS18-CY102]|uniref:hypothetical protein n=1 Tax=Paenibacillus sp. MMS18-CY102 TaxID=2682849 RepID=UPI001365679F|nr:hypothetical protein [Paenibacillus sp. MMS18-CY102]MWC27618.1 hypothetical protein [Paenibacillus sp. MMS18-CY102]
MLFQRLASCRFVKEPALQQQIEAFLMDGSTKYDAYSSMYVCPACRGIQNELYIEMQSDTSAYKHVCSCKRCGMVMEQAEVEHSGPVLVSCPECSEGKLTAEFYMDRD